jgi:hypothetical protein
MDQQQLDMDIPSKPDQQEGVNNDDDDNGLDMDRLAEDLVLHEGDGKISRPIKPMAALPLTPTNTPTTTITKRNASRGNSSTFQKLKDINQTVNQSSTSNNNSKSPLQEAPTAQAAPSTDESNRPSNSAATTKTTNVATTTTTTTNTIPASQNSNLKPPPPRLDETTTLRTKTTKKRSDHNSKEILHRVQQKSGFVGQDTDVFNQEEFDWHRDTTVAGGSPNSNATRLNHSAQQQQQQLQQQQQQYHQQLTNGDIEIFQRLDDEYGRALEEREIGYNARYSSVRQSAFLSILFLLAYMIQGTVVFMHQTEWSIHESLFFSIFTITTVGYGREDLPTTPAFQAYTIFYIMIGVAALTIVVRFGWCLVLFRL